MGATQSTRKISVDNENAIQVSQEALDRIQAQLSAKVNILPNYIILAQCQVFLKQNSKLFLL